MRFSFDGRSMQGYQGDTLASALLANGQRLMGRSFKYHRPRSVVGLGAEEMNALVGVGQGARHEPNLRATQVELYDGLHAVSQNRWPSLALDIGGFSGRLSRFFPAGFYYKTFMWPKFASKTISEPKIRAAAGLGVVPGRSRYRWLAVGRKVGVYTANDSAYAAAIDLKRAGIDVPVIVDTRDNPNSPIVEQARSLGIEVLAGHAVYSAGGKRRVSSMSIKPARGGNERKVAVDALIMSAG